MKIVRGITDAARVAGGVVSIGNFDGVHRGHRSMLSMLNDRARRMGVPAVVFTFDPHPIFVLRPDRSPPPLTTTERKLELLADCGIDGVLVYSTDNDLLELTPREFFDRIVRGHLRARGLVEGPNFLFGHDRAGDIATLAGLCGEAGLSLDVVAPVQVGERIISSTEIRQSVLAGDVRSAGELLGMPYRLRGLVVKGAERGRSLGFPTANLEQVRTVIPRDGVYAGRARVGNDWYVTAMNIGPNPTFADKERKFEAHLIDYAGNLYGQDLDVEFFDRLRDTAPFPDLGALKRQLTNDVAQARTIAETHRSK